MTYVPNSSPYPWPYDGAFELERTALIIVGWDPYWLAAACMPAPATSNIARLRQHVGRAYVVEHRAPPSWRGGGDPPPLTGGESIRAEGVDAFYGSPLEALLRRNGHDRLLLVGLGLETTVHSSLRTANDIGLECLVVVDACAPLDPTLVPQAISMIEMSGGIFGAVANTDDVIATLASPHPSPSKDHS